MSGTCEAVRVDEAADLWVVITALQVIESRLLEVARANIQKTTSILTPSASKGESPLDALIIF